MELLNKAKTTNSEKSQQMEPERNNGGENGEWTIVTGRKQRQRHKEGSHRNSAGARRDWRHDLPSIYIRNIHTSTTKEELRNYFQNYGKVADIFISRQKGESEGRRSCFGFIRFFHKEPVERILRDRGGMGMNGYRFIIKGSNWQAPARRQRWNGNEWIQVHHKGSNWHAPARRQRKENNHSNNDTKRGEVSKRRNDPFLCSNCQEHFYRDGTQKKKGSDPKRINNKTRGTNRMLQLNKCFYNRKREKTNRSGL